MGISNSSFFSEVDSNGYVAGTISVTNTQVEAKVGGSPLTGRQTLILVNKSSVTLYTGPSGVTTTTGLPLHPDQERIYSVGESINIYCIAAAAGPYTVVVHELA